MNKRQKKEAEKLKRAKIHKMLDLALDINGIQVSKREITGDHPTSFFSVDGHVAQVRTRIFPNGWDGGRNYSLESIKNHVYFDDAPCADYSLDKGIEKLKAIKKELMGG